LTVTLQSKQAKLNGLACLFLSFPTFRSIQLKQNLNALFTGHEQGLTLTSEPIDLARVLFSEAGKVESFA
jgi:hypothetical protein